MQREECIFVMSCMGFQFMLLARLFSEETAKSESRKWIDILKVIIQACCQTLGISNGFALSFIVILT